WYWRSWNPFSTTWFTSSDSSSRAALQAWFTSNEVPVARKMTASTARRSSSTSAALNTPAQSRYPLSRKNAACSSAVTVTRLNSTHDEQGHGTEEQRDDGAHDLERALARIRGRGLLLRGSGRRKRPGRRRAHRAGEGATDVVRGAAVEADVVGQVGQR